MKLLSDQPLQCKSEFDKERFGHKDISKTLFEMIKNCPTPFTIGLFGKWGTGKSTINYMLKDTLESQGFDAVIFDAWKYEGDSLRREFLKNIVGYFKSKGTLDKDFTLEAELYKNVSISLKGEPRFEWHRLKALLPYLIGAYLITLVVVFLLQNMQNVVNVPVLFIESLIIPILLGALQGFRDVVITDERSEESSRLDCPELFEEKFQELLDKSKRKKMFIIDNLDRCSHKKAVELLTTLKTFLEKPKCIFLIPCDVDAIKEHIKKFYVNESENERNINLYSDEFIRKFFNVYLKIPEFIDTELQNYTEHLLRDAGIKELNTSEVASIITTAFRDNPRQIKQFINALLSQFLLVQERENQTTPLIKPKGAVTDNVGLLTKLLVIQQKYPSQYLKIKNREINVFEVPIIKNPNVIDQEFIYFMSATRTTPKKKINNLRPFFYLKQSSEELNLPDADELQIALEDAKDTVAIEKLKEIKKSEALLSYCGNFILKLLRENESKPERLLNICATYLKASSELSFSFTNQDLYDCTARFLGSNLKELLHRIYPQLVFGEVLSRCNESLKGDIISQYILILSSQNLEENNPYELNNEWAINLFNHIFIEQSLFSSKISDIKKIILASYAENYNILQLLENKKDLQKIFLSSEILKKYINSITKSDLEQSDVLKRKFGLLENFSESIDLTNFVIIVEKLSELIRHENQQPFRPQREELFLRVEDILSTFYDKIKDIGQEKIEQISRDIINSLNTVSSWNQRRIFIFSLIILSDFTQGTIKNNLTAFINQFISNAQLEDMKFVLDKFNPESAQAIIEEYYLLVQRRSLQTQVFFELMMPYARESEQKRLLLDIVNSGQYQWAIDLLEQDKIKLALSDVEITKTCLDRTPSVALEHRSKFYLIVNKFKCGSDRKLIDQYVDQLKKMIMSNDSTSQRIGYEAFSKADYLSDEDKRLVIKEVINWLRQRTSLILSDEFSIRTTMLHWEKLGRTYELGELIYILFDKILLTSNDIKMIELSSECLRKIMPEFERDDDTKKYFESLLSRVQREQNSTIKETMSNLLKEIKPTKTNSENVDYWSKVSSLGI